MRVYRELMVMCDHCSVQSNPSVAVCAGLCHKKLQKMGMGANDSSLRLDSRSKSVGLIYKKLIRR